MPKICLLLVTIFLAVVVIGCAPTPSAQPTLAPIPQSSSAISVVSTASSSVSSSATGSVQLSQMDSGKQVTLAPGGILEISLDQNASTGYAWQLLASNDSVLRLLSDKPTSTSAVPGAPGKETFKFQAVSAGMDVIWLGYKQWTNAKAEPETTYQVSVIVSGTPVLPTPRPTAAGAPKPLEKLTNLTLADSGKTIAVTTGDTYDVSFDLDGKTPGAWQIISNDLSARQLLSIGIVYPGGTPAVKVPRQTFTFKATGIGTKPLRIGFKDWANESAQPNPIFELETSASFPAVLPTAGAAGTTIVILNKQRNSATVNTSKDTIAVLLQGVPGSTSSLVSGNDAIVKPQFDPTKPLDQTNGGTVPGTPGYLFKFQPVSAGTATLVFAVKSTSATETFTVTANIK